MKPCSRPIRMLGRGVSVAKKAALLTVVCLLSGVWPVPALSQPVDGIVSAEAPRGWVTGEYLLWWFKGSPLPVPLVTSGSLDDAIPGALGQPGTRVLIGGEPIESAVRSGGRVAAGLWVDPERTWGIEGNYLFLPQSHVTRSVATSGQPGSPTLAVPIFDTTGVCGLDGVPGETVFILPTPFGAAPGFQGRLQLDLASQLQGAEINIIGRPNDGEGLHLDGLAGFRWLQFSESLALTGTTGAAAGAAVSGFYNVSDSFQASNNFWGGQLGGRAVYALSAVRLEALAKVALGGVHENVTIDGASQTSSGNLFFKTAPAAMPGGIFTQPSNIGSSSQDSFAVVPEVTTRLSYRLTRAIQLSCGYSFLYVSTLARPGPQIDRFINSTRTSLANASRATTGVGTGPIPFGQPGSAPAASGGPAPTFRCQETDFWAQGIDLGVLVEF